MRGCFVILLIGAYTGLVGGLLAGPALQFDALRADSVSLGASNVVESWTSVRGDAALSPLHGQSNGWERARLAVGARRGVDFATTNTVSPLAAADATNAVAAAFAVVRCDDPADLGTLFDTPVSARFMPRVWPDAPWLLSTAQLESVARYWVNGVETNHFEGDAGFQLIEIEWPEPIALRDIYVGGAAASPAWARGWPGELGEVVFLDAVPTEADRSAVQYYVARKWGVPVAGASDGAREVLQSLGISFGNLFASVLILR
jgi:hypothetical protein